MLLSFMMTRHSVTVIAGVAKDILSAGVMNFTTGWSFTTVSRSWVGSSRISERRATQCESLMMPSGLRPSVTIRAPAPLSLMMREQSAIESSGLAKNKLIDRDSLSLWSSTNAAVLLRRRLH
jgi:hypothetical protein